MKSKQEILSELDAAIDSMDMQKIDQGLLDLSSVEPVTIAAEDVDLFAARILKLNEEKQNMKLSLKPARIIAAVAVIMLMGITVYAATTLNFFSFLSGDRLVTMRTTENMTEQEAKDFATGTADIEGSSEQAGNIPEIKELSFDSVEQAEAEMGMDIVLPSKMPQMKLGDAHGQKFYVGDGAENRTTWLNYSDDAGRMLGITTTRNIVPPGTPFTSYTEHDVDQGSLGAYKSKSGVEYTILTESDDAGERTAHIAVAMQGEYEYALVFFGFDEAERREIIDSADLSVYRG